MADEKKPIEMIEERLQKADQTLDSIQASLKGKVDAETLKGVTDQIETIKDFMTSVENIDGKKLPEYVKTTQEHIDSLEKEIEGMKKDRNIKDPTLADKIKNLTLSDEWKAHMKDMKKNRSGSQFVIEKAANDLLTSDWTAASGTVGLPQMQIPGVTKHPWKDVPVFSAIPKRTVGMDHEVKYTEELTRTDAAALKAEGSQYAQSGATWITRSLAFYDFGHYVKVTRESLEDAEYIQQEMNDLLYNGLLRVIENLLVQGAGTTTVLGIINAAKTFARSAGAQAVSDPSIRDILLAAKLQVEKGLNSASAVDSNKTGYNANMALIGKSTAYNLVTEKDDIGRVLVEDINGWRPGGLNVMQSEDLAETDSSQEFAVFDINKAMLFLKRNLIIETGYDGNDFTYGMMTLRASIRGNMLIKELEKFAFVKGDLATAVGILSGQ